jgi:ubiquinone/menaquinone biosynthesis C-methylase UbiE
MLLTDREIVLKLGIKHKDKVLDIGGSMTQHQEIKVNTLVDIIRPEDSPYGPTKMKADKFVQLDITKQKLPFADKYFDICLCTHTLEDLTNPTFVIDEMNRVAKRGLVVTPSMGYDMKFSPIDYTNWLSGARRVPGEAHHKWFFINTGKILKIIPKYYGILYTHDFQVVDWKGPREMEFYWDGQLNYKEFSSLNIHALIDEYQSFVNENRKNIKLGTAAIFIDNPYNLTKALIKKMLRRGSGYKYRKIL